MKQLFIRFYILLVVGFFVILSGVMPVVDGLLEDENVLARKNLARGTFFFFAQEFSGQDEAGCKKTIERLQPEFGYPLSLFRLNEVQLADKYQTDLINGSLVLDPKREQILMRVGSADLVLTTGPFSYERIIVRTKLFFWSIMTILLILPAAVWSFLMQRNLKKIEKTTDKFVAGDHSIRLELPRVLPLKKIASAFNHMAQATQSLINSQKDLVNSVSHEIRTPLARIKFSLEMLQGSIKDDFGTKDYAHEIKKDVEEINSLVDEMLTYARFEREREPLEVLLKNEMVSWLKEIVRDEQEKSMDRTIKFKIQSQTDQCINRYEPVYLGRAVRNLIQNAVKYTTSKIDVTFESDKDFCCIHVDDDGYGIPLELREKIFEPFSRLDQSRQRKSGGYGLGLAIAKRITLWHKGEISIATSPLQGARFTICIPVFP